MEIKVNHIQYLQVIPHYIFIQLLLFILLPTQHGGLGGVLFDDGQRDMDLDVTANVFYLYLGDLLS